MGKSTTFLWSKRGGGALLYKPGRQSQIQVHAQKLKKESGQSKRCVCVRQSAVSNMKSTTRNREQPLMIFCCAQCPCLRTAPSSRRLVDRIPSGLELETF